MLLELLYVVSAIVVVLFMGWCYVGPPVPWWARFMRHPWSGPPR